jgi:hypothetical protein
MNYLDCITVAAQHAHDRDVPAALLPLTISNEAALLAGLGSDYAGGSTWD